MADPLRYTMSLGGQMLVAREVKGREAMSEPFRLEVFLHLADGQSVDPSAAVRATASLELRRAGVERTITGVITEVAVGEIPPESKEGAATVELVLEPTFALARFKQNTKAFVHKNVVDIVTEVLGEAGVAHSLRLASSYPVRPYTVQYGETDFHFVSRMLEEEGIFYFFDEGGTMVLADHAGAYDSASSIRFGHAAGADQHQDAILGMGPAGSATASKVTLRDWTMDAPSRPMEVTAQGPRPTGPEHYDFPGEYQEPGHGQRIADRMAAALACIARCYRGRASAAPLAPGRVFGLEGAPVGLDDGSYVVDVVEHDYDLRREGFVVRFTARDGSQAYRAPVRHLEPVLPNPVIGEITGPPGADIHTDELGRVKVHFRWDRLQPKDDTCSHWIPVLQDNLAHSVGIPRVGWEVAVHFLEGDPDRPVVLGRVYNGEDRFHMPLPIKKTVTALRSLTSPTRDGENSIELEDLQGRENIGLHSEKNQDVVVENDKTEHVMMTESHEIDNDEAIVIGRDEHIEVSGSDLVPEVEGNRWFTVDGDRTREVAASDAFDVLGDRTLTIGGKHQRRIKKQDNVSAASLAHSVGGVILETSIKANTMRGRKLGVSAVGGLSLEVAGGDKIESGRAASLDLTGGVVFVKAKTEIGVSVVKNRLTLVGVAHKTKAAEQITLSGSETLAITTTAGGLLASESLAFEVGETRIVLEGEQITIFATKEINTSVNAQAMLGAAGSSQISPPSEGEGAA